MRHHRLGQAVGHFVGNRRGADQDGIDAGDGFLASARHAGAVRADALHIPGHDVLHARPALAVGVRQRRMVNAARARFHLLHEGRARRGDRGVDIAVDDAVDRGRPAADFDQLHVVHRQVRETEQCFDGLLQCRRAPHPADALALEVRHGLHAGILGDGEGGAALAAVEHEKTDGRRPPFFAAEREDRLLRVDAVGAGRGELGLAGFHGREPRHVVLAGQHAEIDVVALLQHAADGDHLAVAGGARVVGRGHERIRQLDFAGVSGRTARQGGGGKRGGKCCCSSHGRSPFPGFRSGSNGSRIEYRRSHYATFPACAHVAAGFPGEAPGPAAAPPCGAAHVQAGRSPANARAGPAGRRAGPGCDSAG